MPHSTIHTHSFYAFSSALYLAFTSIHMHSHSKERILEQLGVQDRIQGYFGMQTGAARDQTSNLPISR